MLEHVEVHELSIAEICELLAEAGAPVSEQQAQLLAQYITTAGGLDNALAAFRRLPDASKAAAS